MAAGFGYGGPAAILTPCIVEVGSSAVRIPHRILLPVPQSAPTSAWPAQGDRVDIPLVLDQERTAEMELFEAAKKMARITCVRRTQWTLRMMSEALEQMEDAI